MRADETIVRQWELVQTIGHLTEQRATAVVGPLLTDKWGQKKLYNSLCPEDSHGSGGHVRVGCTATAMAQIMRYWGYPTTGAGSHTYTPTPHPEHPDIQYPEQSANFGETIYDWAHMPDKLTSSSSNTQINAVATLMWHCSVAINTTYCYHASSASPNKVCDALVKYFGYSNELSFVLRRGYSDEDWLTLMKDCLNLDRPVFYCGYGHSGYGDDKHAFVCDGYDTNDYLHFNWGFDGSSNNFFHIGAMNPLGHNYNERHCAIINIHPGCTSGNSYQITATANPSTGGTVSGAGTYDCGVGCTLTATPNEGYSFAYWSENGRQVSPEASYPFVAINDRNLVAHFALPFNITTSVNLPEGGTVSEGGVYPYNQQITLVATPNEGYVFNKWTKNGQVVSCLSTLNLTVTETAEYVANFQQMDGIVIGEAASTNYFLPTYTNKKYSLSQQIYTAEEMGGEAAQISSISFFNTGLNQTRNMSIYMVHTNKTAFDNSSDWITMTEADQVFTGSVTMASKSWAIIYFVTPFSFDGSSNIALIVDDNSGYVSNIICRTFGTGENQAISVCGSDTNYDPYDPSVYTGTLKTEKNQVVFGLPSYDYTVTVMANPVNGGIVGGEGLYYYGQLCTVTAQPSQGFCFVNWTKNGSVVSNDPNYSFIVTEESVLTAHFAPIGNIVFADANVKAICVANWDTNGDGELSYVEAALITSLGEVFRGNTEITSFEELQFFIGLNSISNNAFRDCSGLMGSLILPSSITSIGNFAFSGCSGFTGTLTIPSSVTTIGSSAFSGCSGFTGNLTISNSVTTIGSSAFQGCSGFTGSLTIPNSVTSIGDYAFSGCSGFTGSLTISNSVTSVANYAFRNCSGLESLTIPNSVTTIGNSAFSGCSGFTGSLTIPNSVTTIGSYAFSGCSSFTGHLIICNSVTTIGNSAFSGCSGFTGNLVIGNSVTTIGNSAFSGCSGFTGNLNIGNSVTLIGYSAFYNCRGLTSISMFAETPPTLGSGVFNNVNKTIPVYVPCGCVETYQSVNWGGFNNFYGMCGGTVTVAADPEEGGTVTGGGLFEAGESCTVRATANEGYVFVLWTRDGMIVSADAEYTFYVPADWDLVACFVSEGNIVFADPNVKALCIANWDTNDDGELSYYEAAMVRNIGEVFRGNTEITSFEELQYFINLRSISNNAFRDCSGLTGSLILPSSITSIGNYAFYHCSGLTGSLSISNSVITIGDSAFSGCSGFTGSLTIPNSVTSIGNSSFSGCSGFTGDLTIRNHKTSIGNYAFNGCSGFTGSLTIGLVGGFVPNSTIGNYAFYGCSGFTGNLVIPNSVTTIGNSAFQGCSGFTGNLTIPNSVTSIGSSVFQGCSGFTGNLTIGNSVTTIGYSAFSGCSGFTGNLTIPNSVTTIGNYAFSGCSGFTGNLTIPNSVTTIGNYAFSGCGGLTSIIVRPETPSEINSGTFYNCPKTIPVYVPCGKVEAYQSTSYWSEFTNIMELCDIHFITSGTWGNPDNWSGGVLPEVNDSVSIDANCTLYKTVIVGALSITDGNTLTIQKNGTLIVTRTLTNTSAENLVIEDGAQLVHASENVSAMVKKNIAGHGTSNGRYYLISNPLITVVDPEMSSVYHLITGDYDLYDWLPSASDHLEWRNIKENLFVMSPDGYGYLYANRNDGELNFPGILKPSNNRYAKSVSYDSNDTEHPGWNLIGNPFVCNAYLVDGEGTPLPYYRMNATGDGIEAVAPGTPIAPLEGVFYKASGNEVIYFNRAD